MSPIQTAQGSATSGSTVSATFGAGTTGGTSIVALVSNQSGRTVSSIALTGSSDTFSKAVSVLEGTGGEDSEIWIDLSDSSGHTQVVVTFSGTITGAELTIIEWPAGITSATPDKTNNGSGFGVTSWSSNGTGTLTQPVEIAFGLTTANTEGGGAATLTGPASPWTNLAQINAGTGLSQLAGYQQVNATTSLTYSGTASPSVAEATCIATFKFAPVGASPFTPPRSAPRGASGTRRGRALSGLSSPGAPVSPSPAQFTPPRRAPRGAPGAQRGRALSGLSSRGAPVTPRPSPFTPPQNAPRGAPGARRGRALSGLSSPGAPVSPSPAQFTPPRRAPRGAPGAQRGRSYAGLSAAGTFTPSPAPFTPPRRAPRGAPGAQRGRAYVGLSSPGAPINNPKVLLISLASAAGVDDYGTAYPQGIFATAGLIQGPEIIAGNTPKTQIVLIVSGGTGFLRFVLNSASFANAVMFSQIVGAFAQLVINGPNNTLAGFTDFVGMVLNSSDGSASFANLDFEYTDNAGTVHQYAFVDGSGFNITTGAITATQPGTGTAQGNPAIAETWHAASLPGGWGGGMSYKKYPDNTVGLAGTVTLPSSGSYNNITLFTLPSGYIPPGTKNCPMAAFAQSSAYGNNSSSAGLPRVVITSGGAVSFAGIPASVNSSQVCVDGVRFPVDF